MAKNKRPSPGRPLTSVENPLTPDFAVNLYKGNRTAFPHRQFAYSVICTAHDTVTGVDDRNHALWRLSHPSSFCPACRALADAAADQ